MLDSSQERIADAILYFLLKFILLVCTLILVILLYLLSLLPRISLPFLSVFLIVLLNLKQYISFSLQLLPFSKALQYLDL